MLRTDFRQHTTAALGARLSGAAARLVRPRWRSHRAAEVEIRQTAASGDSASSMIATAAVAAMARGTGSAEPNRLRT
eukprot:1607843-Pleurochrysis_carterae.AAC.1